MTIARNKSTRSRVQQSREIGTRQFGTKFNLRDMERGFLINIRDADNNRSAPLASPDRDAGHRSVKSFP